jgi:hypothetical protein
LKSPLVIQVRFNKQLNAFYLKAWLEDISQEQKRKEKAEDRTWESATPRCVKEVEKEQSVRKEETRWAGIMIVI